MTPKSRIMAYVIDYDVLEGKKVSSESFEGRDYVDERIGDTGSGILLIFPRTR